MRLLIQRVLEASVEVEGIMISKIDKGLLVFVGIEDADNLVEDVDWLIKKLINLRIFPDENGNMNLSSLDVKGHFLVISQFTLHASTKKGNRPSFIRAAKPDKAEAIYNSFVERLSTTVNEKVATGKFGADMKVSLINDGPVTILIDSQNKE